MKKHGLLDCESLESRTLLSTVPYDPRINDQWALSNISAYQAWDSATGSRDVVVAIIDSGVDLSHPDLKNNLWNNPGEIAGDGIDNDTNGYVDDIYGWDFAYGDNNVQDGYGHGTHVAGIIGAVGNNSVGVAGVNWNVSMMVLKFMDDSGVGYGDSVIKAIDYILMMKNKYNIDIVAVNNSYGGTPGYSSLMDSRIQLLNNSNVMFVAAAGNSGADNDLVPRYPSSYTEDNVISVGALTSTNVLAGFSNYGKTSVDIAAPGTSILSTYKGGSYGYMSGTSMAAPFVTGSVALLNAAKPNTSMDVIKDILLSTADKIDSLADKVLCGGKLNLGAAMAKLMGIPYVANSVPNGYISNITLRNVYGYVGDPDGGGSVNIKLTVDGNDYWYSVADSNGNFVFNIETIGYGYHSLKVWAKDNQSEQWSVVGEGSVNVPYPEMSVSRLNIRGTSGRAYSAVCGDSAVAVRVVVNGRLVANRWANIRSHEFNIGFSRSWFRRGYNDVRLEIYDPITKQITLMRVGRLRK